jgi:type VI secretion system secreted protein Hcp
MAMYIQIDGIPGESTDSDHKDWIDLTSTSLSVHRPVPGAHAGVTRAQGAADFDPISISKSVDKSSVKLMEAVAKGTSFKVVKIDLTTSYGGDKRVPYMKYELKDALVTSYSLSGGGEGAPSEHFMINFSEIKGTYTQYGKDGKSKGNVEMTWKVEEGTK